MKKQGIFVLVLISVLFIGFVCGFFIGRNSSHGDIQISKLPESTTTAPVTTAPTHIQTSTTLPDPAPTTQPTVSGKININTATKEQLMTLPGIGAVLADNIIKYRTEHGDFQKVADLLQVDGIGEKRLDAIIEYVTV